MYRSTVQKFVARGAVALALTLGVLCAGAGVAGASSHHHSSGFHDDSASTAVAGVVTAASATSITITERSGTSATFTINTTTTVTEGGAPATTAALKSGERVVIVPSTTTAGLAASIMIHLSQVSGTVSAVSGNNISVTVRNGLSQTVVVSGATTYTKGGASASLTDVTVGSRILASGVVDTTANVLDALTVSVAAPPARLAWVVGKVAAVNGDSISVALRNGLTLSVIVSGATTYTKGGASASLTDVTVGVYIEAGGTVNTTANALDASTVRIGVGGGAAEDSSSQGIGANLFGVGPGAGSGGQHGGQFGGGGDGGHRR